MIFFNKRRGAVLSLLFGKILSKKERLGLIGGL
jgi:hypothetical protein